MRQRSFDFRSAPVGHEPAGDGDGHGHEGQQGRDDERDDEADLGDADLGIGRRRPLRRDLAVGLASLERQDSVGLHLQDKNPEVTGCHSNLYLLKLCLLSLFCLKLLT